MALITRRDWKTIIFTDDETGEIKSRVCTKCGQWLHIHHFGSDGRGKKRPDCLKCAARRMSASYKKDADSHNIFCHRYRATKEGLPSTMTVELRQGIKEEQGGKCLLNGSSNIVTEHFIPLSWGVGTGDTPENLVFMDRSLNISKRNLNPFDWIQKQDKQIQENFFTKLVPLLAKRNGMTSEEYEKYVNDCYKNRLKIKAV